MTGDNYRVLPSPTTAIVCSMNQIVTHKVATVSHSFGPVGKLISSSGAALSSISNFSVGYPARTVSLADTGQAAPLVGVSFAMLIKECAVTKSSMLGSYSYYRSAQCEDALIIPRIHVKLN
jgi:hypothetical protein